MASVCLPHSSEFDEGRDPRMETDIRMDELLCLARAVPFVKETVFETNSNMFKELPYDYDNWSSTVILFIEDKREIGVYALDCDDCTLYYVVSYKRARYLYNEMGYTAGDLKVYFFGEFLVDEGRDQISFPLDVKVYDIPTRQWLKFPTLNSRKLAPFVFFLDNKLYVLSCLLSSKESHFEMLDLNNLSQGWVRLAEPSFVWRDVKACQHDKIIDYSKKMLYVRLDDDTADLYGYSLDDKEWHKYSEPNLTYRTGGLLKYDLFNCAIVENYLYQFKMFKYPDSRKAILIICDLGRDFVDAIHYDDDPPISRRWLVDITDIVAPEVLLDSYADGDLVYLGKRNSFLRFSLVISYSCEPCFEAYHLCTCTFDLRQSSEATASGESSTESFIAIKIGCKSPHINVVPTSIACNKLCEVKDDCCPSGSNSNIEEVDEPNRASIYGQEYSLSYGNEEFNIVQYF